MCQGLDGDRIERAYPHKGFASLVRCKWSHHSLDSGLLHSGAADAREERQCDNLESGTLRVRNELDAFFARGERWMLQLRLSLCPHHGFLPTRARRSRCRHAGRACPVWSSILFASAQLSFELCRWDAEAEPAPSSHDGHELPASRTRSLEVVCW